MTEVVLTREQVQAFLDNARKDLAEDKHFSVHPAAMIFLCKAALENYELKEELKFWKDEID